jgi:hypothetical protein
MHNVIIYHISRPVCSSIYLFSLTTLHIYISNSLESFYFVNLMLKMAKMSLYLIAKHLNLLKC